MLTVMDIHANMNSGALADTYEQHKPTLGKVKLENFAMKFAAGSRS
jgi:hypothetical protein